jgi:DNA-binding LacI/PurR family transcriptional regulator
VRRVTIADIAARAGVSKSTVSHTLSGKRPISLRTQQRIRAVIDELGYRPSVVAQRLAGGGHSRNIGLVFPLSRSYAGTEAKFIVNAANVARNANYAFLLLSHLEGTTAQFERVVESGLVDGFILMQVRMQDRRVDLLRQAAIPFVLLGRCADNRGLSFVDVEIEAGVASAVAHLAALGHQTMAYLGFEDDGDFGFAERSKASFVAQCQQLGLHGLVRACPLTADGAELVLDGLLGEVVRPTALLVRTAGMAEGIIRGARRHGLAIPQELSIIAMGSAEERLLFGGDLQLALIDIHAADLATNATRFLVEQLAGNRQDVAQLLVAPDLLVGDSSGPAVNGRGEEGQARSRNQRTNEPTN